MESDIRTFRYPNGEIQRVQVVRADGFDKLDFFKPDRNPEAFTRLCDLYRNFIVARMPWFFEKLVLFRIPDDIDDPFEHSDNEYGSVEDKLARTKIAFNRHVRIKGERPVFDDEKCRDFFRLLQRLDCLQIICGKLPGTTFLPVGNDFGMMSQSQTDATVKVNSSFFIMDRLDCGSVFDAIGTPVGLQVKDGKIISPPLFEREALLVINGKSEIRKVSLSDMRIEIEGKIYESEADHIVYSRPQFRRTPQGGVDLVIIGNRVAAVKREGGSEIPSGGFVLKLPQGDIKAGSEVRYHGLEDCSFGIQVGNSAVINGKPTSEFRSSFYDFRKLGSTSYPPAMYPLNYEKDRAPRIVLATDQSERPVILWFEGKGKFGYEPGKESCGASLSEVAAICEHLKMKNAVNLDGGGSAQILINSERMLKISDRTPEDFSEVERAVPVGIMIK